jgi:hypothetical protein
VYSERDFSDSLVAFLDILGFRESVVQEDPGQAVQSLNAIDTAVNHALREIEATHRRVFSPKLFSDCICVSCEYTSDNFFAALYELAFLQYYLSRAGIFLRGGLVRGHHFENERMIFSHGLIGAYDLEQRAVYPRILVDAELVDEAVGDKQSYFPIYGGFSKLDFLMKAPDGLVFVDYLNTIREEVLEDVEEFAMHKESIVQAIQRNRANPRVLDKYRWLAEYHNLKFCEFFVPEEWDEAYAADVVEKVRIDLPAILPQFESVAQGAVGKSAG